MGKKIERRNSPIHGTGVFSCKRIRKGEPIVEYKGALITHQQADELHHGDIDTGHTFLFTLNDKWIIDANRKGNVARWINHSCAPNAIAFVHEHKSGKAKKDKVIIEALRDIEPGEEITYDYGFEFDVPYTKKLLAIWACRCGAPQCTGTMLKPKKEVRRKTSAGKRGAKKRNASPAKAKRSSK
jgi:SET domain-containing protein